MFGPITISFGAKMLFNTVRLTPHVTFEDVELAVGELCSVVKATYRDSEPITLAEVDDLLLAGHGSGRPHFFVTPRPYA